VTSINRASSTEGFESDRNSPNGADPARLLARMEQVPFSRWHMKARVVMGSATFFDAFNALSLAFALPTLIRLWHISPQRSGCWSRQAMSDSSLGHSRSVRSQRKWGAFVVPRPRLRSCLS